MYEILLVIHVLIAIFLVGLILIQQGKGAQAGASFGSGASQTVFGSQGSGGFLSRLTGSLAAVFFILNLLLAYYINKTSHREVRVPVENTQTENTQTEKTQSAPDTPPVNQDVPDVP